MIDAGLRARIVCGDPAKLPADLVGRDLDHDLLGQLPPGADPCGENGEFHTFAYAGPMFHEPIPIENGETVIRDGFVFSDVVLKSAAMVETLATSREHSFLRRGERRCEQRPSSPQSG